MHPCSCCSPGPEPRAGCCATGWATIWPARADVAIASAYFLPSRGLRRLLYAVARHGKVRLLLAGRSDVPIARLAAERLYGRLLSRRVRIFEYQPQILHAKLVIVDDVAYVGSANLDRRSLHINYELLLRFEWPELVTDARRWFAQDPGRGAAAGPRSLEGAARTVAARAVLPLLYAAGASGSIGGEAGISYHLLTMSWQDSEQPDKAASNCSAVELRIMPRARDLGGFEVRARTARDPAPDGRAVHLLGPDGSGAGSCRAPASTCAPHPHIGLATVTYLFSGEILHRDSLGHGDSDPRRRDEP